MKLVTRCPQCQTSFRVHEHQLAMRQGRVRCGACGTVFDAYSTLIEVPDDDRAPGQETSYSSLPAPLSASPGVTPSEPGSAPLIFNYDPTEVLPIGEPTDDGGAPSHLEPIGEPAPIAPQWLDATAPEQPQVESPPDEFAGEERALHAGEQDEARLTPARPARAASGLEPSYSLAEGPERPALRKKTEKPEKSAPPEVETLDEVFDFGPRRASLPRRILAGTAASLLGVLLAGQLLFATRGYIVGLLPQARPLLGAMCDWVGCEVSLPRQTDMLMIDATDLQSDGSALTLSAVIRNRAAYDQAVPLLLLTLTDANERPIARRVLEPAQYLAGAPGLQGVLPARGTLNATVHIDGTGLGAANYEIQVFYR